MTAHQLPVSHNSGYQFARPSHSHLHRHHHHHRHSTTLTAIPRGELCSSSLRQDHHRQHHVDAQLDGAEADDSETRADADASKCNLPWLSRHPTGWGRSSSPLALWMEVLLRDRSPYHRCHHPSEPLRDCCSSFWGGGGSGASGVVRERGGPEEWGPRVQ